MTPGGPPLYKLTTCPEGHSCTLHDVWQSTHNAAAEGYPGIPRTDADPGGAQKAEVPLQLLGVTRCIDHGVYALPLVNRVLWCQGVRREVILRLRGVHVGPGELSGEDEGTGHVFGADRRDYFLSCLCLARLEVGLITVERSGSRADCLKTLDLTWQSICRAVTSIALESAFEGGNKCIYSQLFNNILSNNTASTA